MDERLYRNVLCEPFCYILIPNILMLILSLFSVGLEEHIDDVSIPATFSLNVSLQFCNWSIWWVLC
jgi:hypothetical protein